MISNNGNLYGLLGNDVFEYVIFVQIVQHKMKIKITVLGLVIALMPLLVYE